MPGLQYRVFHYFQRWHKFVTKIFYKKNNERGGGSFRLWYPLRIIPLLNFFYDLFFDNSAVSRESVKALLDILGLINALMLGAVLSVITSVSYSDMIETDERYTAGDNLTTYWDEWYAPYPPSVILQNTLGRSVTFFFVCLLVVIFVYADSISKNPGDGTDETDEEKRINQELYYCWWDWAKWAVLVAVFLTGAGIVFAVLAGQQIFYIKYPDTYIQRHGRISWSDFSCTVGFMSYTFRLTFAISAVVAVGACGAGTAAKYSKEDDDALHLWYVEHLQALEERLADDGTKDVATLKKQYQHLCKDYFYLLVAMNDWVELHSHHAKLITLLGENDKFFQDHAQDIKAMDEELHNISMLDLQLAQEKRAFLKFRIKRDYSKGTGHEDGVVPFEEPRVGKGSP